MCDCAREYVCAWASLERSQHFIDWQTPPKNILYYKWKFVEFAKNIISSISDIYVWYIGSGVIFLFYFLVHSDAANAAHGAGVGLFMM